MAVALLIGMYREPVAARMKELTAALKINLALPTIDPLVVTLEENLDKAQAIELCPELQSPKVRWFELGRRATFADYFEYANRELCGQPVIISNSDIFFDASLDVVTKRDLSGLLICLARWEPDGRKQYRLKNVPFSQDCWIFQPPVTVPAADFYLGMGGSDNRIAYEAIQVGLRPVSWAHTIRAHHLHVSPVRHWNERNRLRGPYAFVPIGSAPPE